MDKFNYDGPMMQLPLQIQTRKPYEVIRDRSR